jgi:hypothetical protein
LTPAAMSASTCRACVCDPSAFEMRAKPSFMSVSHTADYEAQQKSLRKGDI